MLSTSFRGALLDSCGILKRFCWISGASISGTPFVEKSTVLKFTEELLSLKLLTFQFPEEATADKFTVPGYSKAFKLFVIMS